MKDWREIFVENSKKASGDKSKIVAKAILPFLIDEDIENRDDVVIIPAMSTDDSIYVTDGTETRKIKMSAHPENIYEFKDKIIDVLEHLQPNHTLYIFMFCYHYTHNVLFCDYIIDEWKKGIGSEPISELVLGKIPEEYYENKK